MTRSIAMTLSWLLACAALPVVGGEALHEATVPVADRSTAARDAAVKQALGEILVRLSGDANAPAEPAGKALIAAANRYLQRYQYEGSGADGLFFRAGFEAAALDAALQQRGVTLWGKERPPLLVWLAVDDGKRRYLLGSDDADPVLATVQAAAKRRGLTLILPLLDLEDQSKLTYTDVQAVSLERLLPASERYAAQAILIGSLKPDGANWVGEWGLHYAAADSRWKSEGSGLKAMLDAGLGQVDARMVAGTPKPTAAVPHAQTRVPVQVEGIQSVADYARVSAYLAGLPTVRSSVLEAVTDRTLEFTVEVQGGAAGLQQVVALGGVLEAATAGSGPAGVAVYRLRP